MPLTASTLSFECDETSRDSMSVVGSTSRPIIYQANVTNIRASLFDGEPSSATFVSDISNITAVRLIIRKNHPQGTILIDKTGTRDGTTTYVTWANGTKQHFLFALSDVETNQAVPSDGTLDIYAVIEVTTASGPVVVGHFNGSIDYDGITGVDNPVLPGTGAQHANYVYAGPTTGAAALPTFRALVSADIPGGGGGGSGSVTSVAFSAPNIFTVTGSPVTASGTINLALAAQSANRVFAGPSSGSAATPAFRALVTGDINMATGKILGRSTAGTGAVEELSRVPNANNTLGAVFYDNAGTPLLSIDVGNRNLLAGGGFGYFRWADGRFTQNGTDGNSSLNVDLSNNNNTDNRVQLSGVNGGSISFLVNGRGSLTLSDDDQVSGFYGLNIGPPVLTANRTLSWADESGTISVRRFDVKTYGAKGAGTTNDTVAIQAAITDAFNAGGGEVYFPKGIYLVSGALDGTTNSVLKIPSNGNTNAPITICFRGEYVAKTSENPVATTGVVIKSTTVGSGTYPAILAGAAYSDTAVGLSAFNYVSVEISNIFFRVTDNPTLGGIQMHNVIDMLLDNVQCDTGTTYASISQPTHNNAVGIIGPGVSNHAQVRLKDVSLFGYYEGIRASEHAYFDHVAVSKCIVGLVAERGNRPFGGNVTIEWCPKMVFVESAAVLDLDVRAEVETGASWYSSVGTEISDVSNVGTGRISYVRVNASVGPVATNLGQTGAANLSLTNIYSGRLTASVNTGYGRTTENTNNGSSAEATGTYRNDVGYAAIELFSSGFGNAALRRMMLFSSDSNQTNGIRFATLGAAPISFATNTSTGDTNTRLRIESDGVITVNNATAKSWGGVGTVFQSNQSAIAFGTVGDITLGSNVYWNGSVSKYIATGPAAQIIDYNGAITLRVAGSGSADGTITWTNALIANNDGSVSVFGPIKDTNGNSMLAFTPTASAVDGFTFTNAATANPATVTMAATGSDTNINLVLTPKGTGGVGVTGGIIYAPSGDMKLRPGASGNIRIENNSGTLESYIETTSGGFVIQNNAGMFRFGGGDSGFERVGAGAMRVINGTTAQLGSLSMGVRDSGTTTVTNGLTIGHQSTGTPAAGLGSAILFNINSSTTADQNAAQIAALWTDATHATRTADIVFYGVSSAAALAETFRVKANGVTVHTAPSRYKGYTVAGLPAGTQGDRAFVTDALTPTFLATAVGGGAVVTPVFYNGTNWVSE